MFNGCILLKSKTDSVVHDELLKNEKEHMQGIFFFLLFWPYSTGRLQALHLPAQSPKVLGLQVCATILSLAISFPEALL